MATLLKAGNATTSASLTPDNTGTFEFRTGSGAGTTAMTIDATQTVSFQGTLLVPGSFNPTNISTAGTLVAGNTTINGNLSVTGTVGGSFADTIFPLSASVAGSALTITLSNTILNFRSSTLSSGTVNSRTVNSPISVVVPSGATLGTSNAVLSRIMVLAIDIGGTVELAVVNQASSVNLDETGLISTITINASADVATTIYSTTQRTNVPYRVVGFIESTQATAGTWNTAPSTIQGGGGNSVVAAATLGYGQIWQNVVRSTGATYYNTTGKAITLTVVTSVSATLTITIDAYVFPTVTAPAGTYYTYIIPPNSSYSVNNGGTATTIELR
jgi:hypothetical protein